MWPAVRKGTICLKYVAYCMYGVMYCTCNPLCVGVYTLVQVSILTTTFVESKLAIVMINVDFDSYNVYTLNGPFSQGGSHNYYDYYRNL